MGVLDFVHGAADEACAEHDPGGCLIIKTAIKFPSRDPILVTLVDYRVKQRSQVFADASRRAQREGAIDLKRDAVILGRDGMSNLSGLRVMVKAGASHVAAREIAQVILLALRGGFGLPWTARSSAMALSDSTSKQHGCRNPERQGHVTDQTL